MVAVLERLLYEDDATIKGAFIISDCAEKRSHVVLEYIENNCKLIFGTNEERNYEDLNINGIEVVTCGEMKVMVLKDIQTMLTDELTSYHFIDSLLETRRIMKLPLIITGNHKAEDMLIGHDKFVEDFTFIHCES